MRREDENKHMAVYGIQTLREKLRRNGGIGKLLIPKYRLEASNV